MSAPAHRWAAAAFGFGLVSGPALWRTVEGFHGRTGNAVFRGPGYAAGFVMCWFLFALLTTRAFGLSRRRAFVLAAVVLVCGGVLWLLPEGWSLQGHGWAGVGIWLGYTLPAPLVALAIFRGASWRWRVGVPAALLALALAWPSLLHLDASYERHRMDPEVQNLVLPHVSGYGISMFRRSPMSRVAMIDVGYTAFGEVDNSGDSDLIVSEWAWNPAESGCAGLESIERQPPVQGCEQLPSSRQKLTTAGGTTLIGRYGDLGVALYAPYSWTGEVSMPFPPTKLETLFASLHPIDDHGVLELAAL